MPVVCPECDKDDRIQKLTSITAAGEASGTFSGPSVGVTRMDGKWGTAGSYTTLSGTSMTRLARKLLPPQEPKEPVAAGALYVVLALILWAFSLAAIVGGAFLFVAAALDSSQEFGRFVALAAGPINCILGIAMMMGGFFLVRQQGKSQDAARARYSVEKPAWEQSMTKYHRSYYCSRDFIVFDPETGDTAKPDDLHPFLCRAHASASDELLLDDK